MAICGIYKYQNLINNKIYIGQAMDIAQRRREHRHDASNPHRDNCIFHKAIRKYGEDNFSFEIIEECSKGELNEKEQYQIKYYNSEIPSGYNMTSGGDSSQGEIFKKAVEQYDLYGNFIKEFENASDTARQLNLFVSNITSACRGEYSQCGGFQQKYKEDDKKITLIAETNGKIVAQYDKNMNLIKIYPSAKIASQETNINVGGIRNCCNGYSKSSGGYIQRHQEEKENNE